MFSGSTAETHFPQ